MLAKERQAIGFTLIELITAVAIVGTLLALLLPAIQQAREAARRMHCSNNLKQVGVALHRFEISRGAFPASKLPAEGPSSGNCEEFEVEVEDNPGICSDFQSWTASCLSYLEESSIASQYYFDDPWSSVRNRPAVSTEIAIFVCPSVPHAHRIDSHFVRGAAVSDYSTIDQVEVEVFTDVFGVPDPGVEARRGALAEHVPNPPRRIVDGLSKTVMVAESAGRPYVYVLGHSVGTDQVAGDVSDEIVTVDGEHFTDDGIGWADPEGGASIKGASEDGLKPFGPRMINATNMGESYGFHAGGALFLFADGSVRFLGDDIDPWVYVSLCTRAGGEAVDGFPR